MGLWLQGLALGPTIELSANQIDVPDTLQQLRILTPSILNLSKPATMPYPLDLERKSKHDLVSTIKLPPEGTDIVDAVGFDTTQALLQAVSVAPNTKEGCKLLTPIYSYADAPKIPLSRALAIVGVAHVSLGFVRRAEAIFSSCTIASKRDDTPHLPAPDKANVRRFAQFLRRLRQSQCVAIVAPDKYDRIGMLQPMEDAISTEVFDPQDFAATLYIGTVAEIKQQQQQPQSVKRKRPSTPPVPPTTPPMPPPPNDSWDPPDKKAKDPTEEEDGGEFWKPPTANDDGDDDGGGDFWKPPGDGGDANDDDGGWGSGAGNGWGNEETSDTTGWGAGTEGTAASVPGAQSAAAGFDETQEHESAYHADKGAETARDFYNGLKRNMDTRAHSRIFHMRSFNGWVKATQIQELNPNPTQGLSPLRVLDLACGKGGDLGKWTLHNRGIGNYVGLDVADQSLVDAAIRARKMRKKLPRCSFTCADLGSDVPGRPRSRRHTQLQRLSTWSLHLEQNSDGDPLFLQRKGGGISVDDTFDVVSVQFAIHYMMQTRQRARRFFQTVSQLLVVGGNLIATTIDARVVLDRLMKQGLDLHSKLEDPVVIEAGAGACRITFEPQVVEKMLAYDGNLSSDVDVVKEMFTKKSNAKIGVDEELFGLEYTFTLVEGSDHAAGVGDAVNLPEWLIPIPVLQALACEAGLELEYAQNFHEFFDVRRDPNTYSAVHSSMYNMKVLNRNGSISADEWDISRLYCALKFRKVRESILDPDEFLEGGGEDEEEELDPKVKARFMIKALASAKRATGEGWGSLSPEEKNEIIEGEVRKLAKEAKSA